jgi:hypothetical protein
MESAMSRSFWVEANSHVGTLLSSRKPAGRCYSCSLRIAVLPACHTQHRIRRCHPKTVAMKPNSCRQYLDVRKTSEENFCFDPQFGYQKVMQIINNAKILIMSY